MTTTPNPTAEPMLGWHEFILDGVATTHIAYVYEDGSIYFPEGPEVVTEADFRLASAAGRVFPLVRAADLPGGDPTEEQIELAAAAEAEGRWWNGGYKSRYRDQSPAKSWQNGFIDGAKWAAAGVAPQADAKPVDTLTEQAKNQAVSSHVARQEPSGDALRDAVDHVRGAVEFQDAVNAEAVRVIVDAAILGRPKVHDPATSTLVAEAREWAKYDVTGASKIVLELCDAIDAPPAPSPDREKLIAIRLYCENQGDKFRHHAGRILEMLDSSDALAAQPVLDESKVAEVIWERAIQKTSKGFSIFNWEGAHKIARALCEAAKRGELT